MTKNKSKRAIQITNSTWDEVKEIQLKLKSI